MVACGYQGIDWLGNVVRINRKTIAVDTLGKTNKFVRLPLRRTREVIASQRLTIRPLTT